MKTPHILAVLLLSLSSVQAVATPPTTRNLYLEDLELKGYTFKISPNYQIILEFPKAIDLLGGNNTSLFKATIPEAPQDHFLLLDALNSSGTASLTVIVGGHALPLTLELDGKSKLSNAVRKYVILERQVDTSREAQPILPSSPMQKGNTSEAAQRLNTALEKLKQLKDAPKLRRQVSLTASLEAVDSSDSGDLLELNLENGGDSNLKLKASDLRLELAGRILQVRLDDLELPAGESRTVQLEVGVALKAGDRLKVSWKGADELGATTLEGSVTK
jgi:hypothetical protein